MDEVQEALTHHWAMDDLAAQHLAGELTQTEADQVLSVVDQLDPNAVALRDEHRATIGRRFVGNSRRPLFWHGPCSTDEDVDYTPLFNNIIDLRDQYPEADFGGRFNDAKPRTVGGWKGLWYSTDKSTRRRMFEIKNDAFERGIPIIMEITEGPQLGAFAPWLSAAWVGARDMESTALRGSMSMIHLPVGVKNPRDGSVAVVHNALKAIRSNSKDNDGSGADMGTIASTPYFRGVPTGILPVGEGNKQNTIIARGYELPKYMTREKRHQAAITHLSEMCLLGAKLSSAVMIDGTHGVPPMFDIDREDPDRFLGVLEEIHKAIRGDLIEAPKQIAGILGEVGPVTGRTDPNLLLDKRRRDQLAKLVGITIDLLP